MLAIAAACAPVKKAPPLPEAPTLTRTDVVTGLSNPWDMAFLDDGTMFFTQRHGPISVKLGASAPVQLVPADPLGLVTGGDAGILGIAADPNFAANRYIYVCYSHTDDNRVVRFTVDPNFSALTAPFEVVTGIPRVVEHNGCRVRFRPGTSELFITTGDTFTGLVAVDPHSLAGKVLRVDTNGAAVAGNPFNGTNGDTRIYTLGHRNPQGLAFRGGASYAVEHGSTCDDEVNRLVSGGNYGWDGDSNGQPDYEQTGVPMTDFVQYPNAIGAVWSSGCPTIAPSGATFLSGSQWKGWDGALALAVLRRNEGGLLRIIFLSGDQVTGQLDAPIGTVPRLRSAVQGPDGDLYIATDVGGGGGAIWRIHPT